jgi:hypothetical protein
MVKVTFSLEQAKNTRGGVEIQLYSFLNLAVRWWWVVNAMPLPIYPAGKTWCPLYMRLGGPQGLSGWVWKILSPVGFNPRTVQSIVSRYTEWNELSWPTNHSLQCR